MADDFETVGRPESQAGTAPGVNCPPLPCVDTLDQAPVLPDSRYKLGGEIARGGMGEVCRAVDVVLGRDVAVKILQSRYEPNSTVARRFHHEARVTAQLQHPGIPPVHDLCTLPDGRPFLVMKLIRGETLHDLLARRNTPTDDRGRLVGVFEHVCQAVAYAHAQGVIHRDLKPANVMVGAFGETQVMDWGLAKVLGEGTDAATTTPTGEFRAPRDSDDSLTQAGSVIGTPAFMPPEQAAGAVELVDARSDVFGLGAILAVILTGQPPFVSTSGLTTRVKAARGEVAECFTRLDACGAESELIALCRRCLAPNRDERPADAAEVARAVAGLRAAADDRARRAEREVARAAERRKRQRVQVQLAATALTLVLAVGASAWVLHDRQQAAEVQRHVDGERHAEEVRAERVRAALDRAALEAMGGQFDQARMALADAEANGASAGQLRFLRGVIAFYGDDSLTAVEELRRATDLMPESVAARAFLASALNSAGDSHGFDREIRECLNRTPSTAEDFLFRGAARMYTQPREGLNDVDEALRRRPSTLGAVLRADVLTALAEQTGDLDTAREAISAAHNSRAMLPNDSLRLSSLVLAQTVCYAALRFSAKPGEADALLKRSSADARDLGLLTTPTAIWTRGLYLHAINDGDGLERLADEVERVPLAAIDSWAVEVFATRRCRTGRAAEALELLDRMSAEQRNRVYESRTLLALESGAGDRTRAVKELRLVLSDRKGGETVWDLALWCQCGEFEEARTLARRMKADSWSPPPDSRPECHTAILDFYLGEATEDQLFELARGSRTHTAWMHWTLGSIKLARGEFTGAAEHFRAHDRLGVLMVDGVHWAAYWADKLENDQAWPKWIRGKQ